MKLAPIPQNETERMRAVRSLDISSPNVKERLDRIARITQSVFNVSCTFITLVSDKKVKILSGQDGVLQEEVPREISFCGHTIGNKVTRNIESRLLEVIDTQEDLRFYDNPLVSGMPLIRYYLGYVLQSLDKKNVGTLCMTDTRPRNLTSVEKQIFIELGTIAETEINENTLLVENEHKINKLVETIEQDKNIFDYVDRLCGISDAANELLEIIDKYMQRQGISIKEWRVLNEIIKTKQVTPSFVSAKTNISPPIVSKLLEALETKKLIERVYLNREDRRKVSLSCTDKGKNLWEYGKSYAETLQSSIERVSKSVFK